MREHALLVSRLSSTGTHQRRPGPSSNTFVTAGTMSVLEDPLAVTRRLVTVLEAERGARAREAAGLSADIASTYRRRDEAVQERDAAVGAHEGMREERDGALRAELERENGTPRREVGVLQLSVALRDGDAKVKVEAEAGDDDVSVGLICTGPLSISPSGDSKGAHVLAAGSDGERVPKGEPVPTAEDVKPPVAHVNILAPSSPEDSKPFAFAAVTSTLNVKTPSSPSDAKSSKLKVELTS
ncbi:hypothetical protein K488DRAFT_87373 [Vararia minispora EC-137]|uniref:Uncharacterized protein n=1 Tax=Vararia minispora EC-137 TaxID=1314806 RepID=A0ACB8QGT8_9AGAM|nr:hypothetical protein K488DRAFT_87373 [Vararia minispora EC-137]